MKKSIYLCLPICLLTIMLNAGDDQSNNKKNTSIQTQDRTPIHNIDYTPVVLKSSPLLFDRRAYMNERARLEAEQKAKEQNKK